MSTEREDRKQKMLEKVRKLLAMARDGRGNENEADTAMRQANKIMAEYGIDEAEADMTAIDAGEMVFGQAQCGPDGRAPEKGKVYRSMPGYAGVLAVGVARFTDTIVTRTQNKHGDMLVFKGERDDCLLARWLLGVLVHSILAEQQASGWTARGDANSFRMAAASALQKRLQTLAHERRAMYEKAKQESNSRALIVVDRKGLEIASRFGVQKTRTARSSYRSSGAAIAGQSAGQRINIPAGRPIGGSGNARLQ